MRISLTRIIEEDLLGWIVIAVIVIGVLVYNGIKLWEENPELVKRLPATVVDLFSDEFIVQAPVKTSESEGVLEPTSILPQEFDYIETADPKEGITHLARKALKRYLVEKPHNPGLTAEHKIYIEDYLAKAKGNTLLKVGEQFEFSEDLLKEAITEAETLTSEQLQNLTQYSQIVPSLNY